MNLIGHLYSVLFDILVGHLREMHGKWPMAACYIWLWETSQILHTYPPALTPSRAQMVAHYEDLKEAAELRRVRAEWRARRMELCEKRWQFMEEDGQQWRKEGEGEKGEGEREEVREEEEGEGEGGGRMESHASGQSRRKWTESDAQEERRGGRRMWIASLTDPLHKPVDPSEGVAAAPPLSPGGHLELEEQSLLDVSVATSRHAVESQDSFVESHDLSVEQPMESHHDRSHDVSVEQPLESHDSPCTRGHAPSSTAQELLYSTEGKEEHRSTRGHASSSTAQELLYSTEGKEEHRSTRGHTSSSTAQELLYSTEGKEEHRSTRGHASSSTAQDLLYSTEGKEEHRSTRGHASSSTAQELLYSTEGKEEHRSTRGHASSSTAQDLLYSTEGKEEHRSTRGHASSSTAQELLYSTEGKEEHRSTRGHAPSSTAQELLYSTEGKAEHRSTRGHAPSSTAQELMYSTEGKEEHRSTRGHAPSSTAQKLMLLSTTPHLPSSHPTPTHVTLPPFQPYRTNWDVMGKIN